MLRIDVNRETLSRPTELATTPIPPTNPFVGKTGDDEIWAYGLRNPFRDSFDRLTGDLWIGDVGKRQREEIDFAGRQPGGDNYGWRTPKAHSDDNASADPIPAGLYRPIYDYGRGTARDFHGETVIGGYAYRGPDPDLQGLYFFGDADQRQRQRLDSRPQRPGTLTIVDNINAELGDLFNDVAPEFGTMVPSVKTTRVICTSWTLSVRSIAS